jgi:hypothetical protein
MNESLTIEREVHFQRRGRGARKQLQPGAPSEQPVERGRLPRVARLLALALRFERLLREGVVADYAELARLGHVSSARVSQIMTLLHLAPDLQEAILFLPRTQRGRAALILADVLPIASLPDRSKQRRMWQRLAIESAVPGD